MAQKIISHIIALIIKAQELASKIGIPNLLQPGLVKEMIISEILGHEMIYSKRDADARDRDNHERKFEYLSCYEGGTGQLDRMFKGAARQERGIFTSHYTQSSHLSVNFLQEKTTDSKNHL